MLLLERYGVVILPALVIAEKVGIPLPAVPGLLAVGALAAVALPVDLVWYELGRRRGASALSIWSCVSTTAPSGASH